jgi:CRP-like cAMP-binding protein
MTHQQNEQFNSYKEGLDLEFLREYCMEHGERRVMERGETLEEAGEPAQWVAFVERGCFKYMVQRSATKETLGSSKNDEEGKDYCTGFAFEGEFVSDFPYCLVPQRHAQLPEHHPQGYHVRSEKIAHFL